VLDWTGSLYTGEVDLECGVGITCGSDDCCWEAGSTGAAAYKMWVHVTGGVFDHYNLRASHWCPGGGGLNYHMAEYESNPGANCIDQIDPLTDKMTMTRWYLGGDECTPPATIPETVELWIGT